MEPSNKASLFNKMSLFFLQAVVFLIPFFFLPFVRVPLDVSKGFLFSIGIILSFLCFVIARLADGSFSIPRTRFMLAAGLLPLVFLVASILSPNFNTSFWGGGFDVTTASGSILLFLLLILTTSFFKDTERIKRVYNAIFIGFIPLVLFQVAFMFVPFNQFFAKVFMEASPTLIGGWNDLAIYTGAVAILALITLEQKTISTKRRIFVSTILFLGLLLLAAINFTTVWIMVGVAALFIFVYTLSFGNRASSQSELTGAPASHRTFTMAPFVVILVSLFFIMTSASLGARIANTLGTGHSEVRPSISSTFAVLKGAVMKNPITGAGPNRFAPSWFLYKPADINGTIFWDTGFSSGFGTIPTFFVTTGILGILAWLFFLWSFFFEAFKSRVFAIEDPEKMYTVFSALILSMYFWVMAVIYVPNSVNLILAMIVTGVFIGALISAGVIRENRISFLHDPRASFFSILLLVVLMIFTIVGGYVYVEKFASIVLFNKATANVSYSPESLDRSEQTLLRSIELSEQDAYYRSLSEIYLYKLSYLMSQKNLSPDVVKPELQSLLDKSRASAEAAVRYDPTNYFNRLSLARVYEAIVPLKVTSAYDNARVAYEEALKRNPTNPGLYLSLARLEIANDSNGKAREYIKKALDKKGNFVEAIFLLAQIEQSEGNTTEAIRQASQAAILAPNDPSVFFELGLLKYNNRDYSGAVGALERSALLSPTSLNIHYFLGLAYSKAGRTNDALLQFRAISAQVPQNQDLKKKIQNLEAGREALDGISSGDTASAPAPTALPVPEKKN